MNKDRLPVASASFPIVGIGVSAGGLTAQPDQVCGISPGSDMSLLHGLLGLQALMTDPTSREAGHGVS